MKSLHKTFDILEYVILRNGENVTPSEAADALQVNLATCTRIMGELVKRGCLQKVSRKSGYVAGPMVASLNTRQNLYKRIADAAELPVKKLSEALRCQVNISVLHENERIMLAYHLPGYPAAPWEIFRFSDHWDTATGRLLLAALEESESKKVCKNCGIKPYPGELLRKIRDDGYVRFEQDSLCVIGHWIRIPGYPVAAFGFGVPQEFSDKAFELSAEAAEEIRKKLTAPVCQAY